MVRESRSRSKELPEWAEEESSSSSLSSADTGSDGAPGVKVGLLRFEAGVFLDCLDLGEVPHEGSGGSSSLIVAKFGVDLE